MSGVPLLWVNKVHKRYKQRNKILSSVLNGVDLTLHAGDVLGLLGRNGAGKSTLVKIICGLVRPTSGSVRVLDMEPSSRHRMALNQRLGVVFGQKTALWWDLSVRDNLKAMQAMYQIAKDKHKSEMALLIGSLNLQDIIDRPIRVLSLGERVKAELACSLLHGPELIILDEPTIGLDLVSKHELRSYLTLLAKQKKVGILLTSHDTGDLTNTCNKIALLEDGVIDLCGTVGYIKESLGGNNQIMVTAENRKIPFGICQNINNLGQKYKSTVEISCDRSKVKIIAQKSNYTFITKELLTLNLTDYDLNMSVSAASLEDVLLDRFKK